MDNNCFKDVSFIFPEDRIQHFDAMAQSYCASRVPSSEWVFAVYRDCNNNPPTNVRATISVQTTRHRCSPPLTMTEQGIKISNVYFDITCY